MNAMLADVFGPDGLVLAVIAVAVLFGAKRIPEIARSIGRAQGEFKKGMREGGELGSHENKKNTEPEPPSDLGPDDGS